MLNPTSKSDRLNYGSIIIPDVGYHLERAVGTTYSLELEILIAIAIKVGLIQDSGDNLLDDLTGMLAALSKVSDKMVVFCEAGQIKKATNAKPVFLLLEKIVVPVAIGKKNRTGNYASFHPKFWLLQYADNEGNYKYRLIVLSRNLTFDHSWDIAVSFKSRERKGSDKNTERIQAFLDYLVDQICLESKHSDNQLNIITQLRDDLGNVSFEVNSELFKSFDFLPLGIGENSSSVDNPFFESTNSGLFIISPFLSKSIIKNLADNCDSYDMTLITRKTELCKIADVNGYDFDVYVVKDNVVIGESGLSEFVSKDGTELNDEDFREEIDFKQQDIHAKLYLLVKGQKVQLYLGSANASYKALNTNVETLVCLHTQKNHLNTFSLFQDVIGDEARKDCPFEEVDFDFEYTVVDDEVKSNLEITIKEICRLKRRAVVETQKDNLYTVNVKFGNYECPYKVTVTPFLCKVSCELCSGIIFSNLELDQLSEFYIISVSSGKKKVERIITVPTEGIPDLRDAEIVRSVIKDDRQFLEYISLLLDADYLRALYEKKELHTSGFYKYADLMPAVYEKMLHAAFESPDKVRDIQNILNMLEEDKELVPAEFIEMYNTFCRVIGLDQEVEE